MFYSNNIIHRINMFENKVIDFYILKNMKIAICTLCINDWYYDIVKYCVKTSELYAKNHNYDFFICNDVYDNKRECPWYKIKAIQKILVNYDYVLWLDADGFIVNFDKKIEELIFEYMQTCDILCTKDWNSVLNTGVMILKNTPYVHSLLYSVWNNKEEYDAHFHEQASMTQIYINNRLNSKYKINILPLEKQHILYSGWADYYPEKTFFVHIARCSHDPCGFVYTLDYFCPIEMKEDVYGEYEQRKKWLKTTEICRKTIQDWISNGQRTNPSTRSCIYTREFYSKNVR